MLQPLTQDKEFFPVKLDGATFYIRVLKPWHFLELSGIPFTIFKTHQIRDKFAAMQARLEKESKENDVVTPASLDLAHKILNAGVKGYDKESFSNLEDKFIVKLSAVIIYKSLSTLKDYLEVNENFLINCHYLAKNYGKTPFDYINMNIDEFIFCMETLRAGLQHEEQQYKRAQKRR